MEQALGQTTLADLFGGCCERLLGAGIPLSRAYIAFRVLHPLYEAMGMTWLRGSGVESASYIHREGEQPPEPLASSPIPHMVRAQLPFLRRRLTGVAVHSFETPRCSFKRPPGAARAAPL
jgi:adenylate cyclase